MKMSLRTQDPWLIALDLDGTLLTPEHTISPRTIEAVAAAREDGHTVVIATGRPPRSALPFHRQLALDTPIVTLNGALILDPVDLSPVHSASLPRFAAPGLIRIARDLGGLAALAEVGHTPVVCRLHSPDDHTGAQACDRILDIVAASPFADLSLATVTHTAPEDGVASLLLFLSRDVHDRSMALAKQQLGDGIHLRAWRDPYGVIEVSRHGTTKASAISLLRERLGISAQRVLAFGDEMNDYDMLSQAAVGVAMGNANPALIPACSAITDSCARDGVARYLEKTILRRQSASG